MTTDSEAYREYVSEAIALAPSVEVRDRIDNDPWLSGRFDGADRTVRAMIGDVDLQPNEARRLATAHASDAERRSRKESGG